MDGRVILGVMRFCVARKESKRTAGEKGRADEETTGVLALGGFPLDARME